MVAAAVATTHPTTVVLCMIVAAAGYAAISNYSDVRTVYSSRKNHDEYSNPLLNLPSRLLAALTFAIVKSQRIAGCCHLANSAEAYPQLPKPSNFYYILGGAARCKRRRRLIFQWSFRVFSFDATTEQRLDGFSPNLHQKTSLRC